MNQWVADLRFAIRSLRSRPLLTGLAAASLALAIAGNGARFSFMNALLLRPMPYPDPERVVMLWQTDPANPAIDLIPVASANYDDWRRTAESFEVLAAQRIRPMSITGGDLPEPISGAEVTAEFFPLLGARCSRGGCSGRRRRRPPCGSPSCPIFIGRTGGEAIRLSWAGRSNWRASRTRSSACSRKDSSSCRPGSRCGHRWTARRRRAELRIAD